MPKNIPDLILSYLNKLNSNVTEDKLDYLTIHKDLKAIAWKCLETDYRPTSAKIEDVKAVVSGDNPEARLQYFEDRFRLIKTIEPAKNQINFDLDPLAEYLAALYLIDSYADQEDLWKIFLEKLEKAQDITDSPESIKGFLWAVRDCCLVYEKEVNIPLNFVSLLAKF